MAILTPKMATNRYSTNSGSCALFLPFTAGSGNVHTDQISGFTVTDDGTCGWTVAHSATTNCTGAITSGSLPYIPANKDIILMDCLAIDTSASLNNSTVGAASGSSRLSLAAGGSVPTSSGIAAAAANFQTLTAGQICCRLMTFDNTLGVLNVYSKVGAAAAQFDATDTDITGAGTKTFVNSMTIGGNGTFIPEYYGIALFLVDDIPSASVILSAMEEAHKNWTNGVKTLPAGLLNA